MTMKSLSLSKEDIEYLITLADQAGAAIMEIYQDPNNYSMGQTAKTDHSPLTEADLAANRILVRGLKRRWPAIPILSEEGADSFGKDEEPPCYWAVDPLDGTKEFIKRNDEFTVNIALIYFGYPVMGLVLAPALESLYLACKYLDKAALDIPTIAKKRCHGQWHDLRVTKNPLFDLSRPIRIVASRSHPSVDLQHWLEKYPNHELIEIGSSLKFCLVAEGKADLYPRMGPTCIWDTAAGHAVVLAAGGHVKDMDLVELTYPRPTKVFNPYFLVTAK